MELNVLGAGGDALPQAPLPVQVLPGGQGIGLSFPVD